MSQLRFVNCLQELKNGPPVRSDALPITPFGDAGVSGEILFHHGVRSQRGWAFKSDDRGEHGSRHQAWVDMGVGFRDMTLQSLRMASGHGSGVMPVPRLLGWSQPPRSWAATRIAHMTQPAHLSLEKTSVSAGSVQFLTPWSEHSMGYPLVAMLIVPLI